MTALARLGINVGAPRDADPAALAETGATWLVSRPRNMCPSRATANRANQGFRYAVLSRQRSLCCLASEQAIQDTHDLGLSKFGFAVRLSSEHIIGALAGPIAITPLKSFRVQSGTAPITSGQALRVRARTISIAVGKPFGVGQRCLPSLLNHVPSVGLSRPQPEMSHPLILNPIDDINPVIIVPGTGRVVTHMVDLHAVRDRTTAKNPGRAVRSDVRSVPTADADPAVAIGRQEAGPAPATFSTFDHQFEAVREGFTLRSSSADTDRGTMNMHLGLTSGVSLGGPVSAGAAPLRKNILPCLG